MKKSVPVNHTLTPIQGPIQSFKMGNRTDNSTVILVDTPGFENTGPNSSKRILIQVVRWMKQKYFISSLMILWTHWDDDMQSPEAESSRDSMSLWHHEPQVNKTPHEPPRRPLRWHCGWCYKTSRFSYHTLGQNRRSGGQTRRMGTGKHVSMGFAPKNGPKDGTLWQNGGSCSRNHRTITFQHNLVLFFSFHNLCNMCRQFCLWYDRTTRNFPSKRGNHITSKLDGLDLSAWEKWAEMRRSRGTNLLQEFKLKDMRWKSCIKHVYIGGSLRLVAMNSDALILQVGGSDTLQCQDGTLVRRGVGLTMAQFMDAGGKVVTWVLNAVDGP